MSIGPTGSIAVTGGRDPSGAPVDLVIVDGVVTTDGVDGQFPMLDATGCVVAPGFMDLQVNGAAGIDLTSDPARLWEVAAALPRFGVTGFLPTIVSSPRATVDRALAVLAAGPPAGWRGARPLGLHLEGPMIARACAGAHDPEHIRAPSAQVIAGWTRDAGVAMVTLAPELSGAAEVTAELARRGVVVAAGHTQATADQARDAVDAGISAVTHLFNAMAPIHHRSPGLVGAALGDLAAVASVIADGVHVHPDMVRLAWRALGPQRRILVSDAVAALGAPAGTYALAAREIVFDGREARRASGALAGGTIGLDACVRNIVAMTGCGPADAIRAVTATPAGLIGRRDLGGLRPGSAGDVVVLDAGLDVVATVVAGVIVHGGADRRGQ